MTQNTNLISHVGSRDIMTKKVSTSSWGGMIVLSFRFEAWALDDDVVGERRPLVAPLHRRDPNRVRHKGSSKDQCIFPLDAQLVA